MLEKIKILINNLRSYNKFMFDMREYIFCFYQLKIIFK